MSATASPKKGKLRDTPLSFAEVILKMPLYNWQGKILFAVEKGASLNRLKVAVVAPNAARKSTRIVAVSALHWLGHLALLISLPTTMVALIPAKTAI